MQAACPYLPRPGNTPEKEQHMTAVAILFVLAADQIYSDHNKAVVRESYHRVVPFFND